ncbi:MULTISPECIES: hypothetical protein [unclassified Spirosoma]|uniref:hypothetical protein n=1 Tax=unclassified Spirosoma TaxID=2621999 RepID=UPI0009696CAA|nr:MULTISPECIES: hypothetical protein [unclassified Spirosoma]MBN8821374.1 hypothetical protein [Spirosoma sp.]OJW78161.1 MAG: hypothetical protein BGO59_29530 [Spirosoma sp. 48-14]
MNPTNKTNTDPNVIVSRPLPPDEISPKSVVLRVLAVKNVFYRNWKLLVILVGIGGIGGFIYDMMHKPRIVYTGSIMFNLGGGSSSSSFGGDLGQLASAFGLSSGAPDANIFVGDNFLIYATSRPVLEKTLMKTDTINGKDTLLVNYYIRHSGIRDKEWEDNDSLRAFYFKKAKTPDQYTKMEQIVMAGICGRIEGEMAIKQPERKSSFMQLECFMEDEKLTATFLNTHLKTIEEDYQKKQTKKTREMYEMLEQRADSLAKIITGTENQLAQYMDQNQQVVVAQAKLKESKLTRNSSFLSGLYYQALQSADNMRLSLIRETPLFTVIEPVAYPLYREVIKTQGLQVGIALTLILSIVIIFVRETYRSIMKE